MGGQTRPNLRHQMRPFMDSAEYLYARGALTAPMSRAFNGSTQYLTVLDTGTTFAQSYAATIAAWFRDTSAGVASCVAELCNAANNETFGLYVNGSGAVRYRDFNSSLSIDTANTYSIAGQGWNHGCIVGGSATSHTSYLNGDAANKGFSSTNAPFPGVNYFGVGSHRGSTPGSYFTGNIGEVAIWSIALSAAEVAFLNTPLEINGVRGFPPACFVQPSKLIGYWPLFGTSSPEIPQGGVYPLSATTAGNEFHAKSLTVTGATKGTTRPPIVYPPMMWDSGS